jgi:PAS domain S-box-containing protein
LGCLEIFVREVYKAKQTKNESVKSLLLSSKSSRERFIQFIKLKGDDGDEVVVSAIDRLQDIDDDRSVKSTASINECIQTLSYLDRVSSYVESPDYNKWRAHERASVYEIMVTSFRSKGKVHADRENVLKELFFSLLQNDFEKVMASSTWISSLIASGENLPIALLLLHGHNSSIISVNRKFQLISGGYDQNDMKGHDLQILQRQDDNESHSRHELNSKFELFELFYTDILITRKDETTFIGQLCFKPIFDQFMVCQYWVGILEDCNNHKNDSQILLKYLPNRVVL